MKPYILIALMLVCFGVGVMWHKSWYTPKSVWIGSCKSDQPTYIYFSEEEANEHGGWVRFHILEPKWQYRNEVK